VSNIKLSSNTAVSTYKFYQCSTCHITLQTYKQF